MKLVVPSSPCDLALQRTISSHVSPIEGSLDLSGRRKDVPLSLYFPGMYFHGSYCTVRLPHYMINLQYITNPGGYLML